MWETGDASLKVHHTHHGYVLTTALLTKAVLTTALLTKANLVRLYFYA